MGNKIRIKLRDRQNLGRTGQPSVDQNRMATIRRVLIAAITGKVPDEHRLDAIRLLSEALQVGEDDVRGLAVIGLFELGGPPQLVIPILCRAVYDPYEVVRRRSVRMLGEIGGDSAQAIETLNDALNDDTLIVRLETAYALSKLGAAAAPAIPGLIEMLCHQDCRIWMIARAAIKRIGRACIPFLLNLLANPNPQIRERVATLLGLMKIADEEVIERLLECTTDENSEVRQQARAAIEKLETPLCGIQSE